MWRSDRQTDTRKAAIGLSDISESTYARVTYFYRLLLVVTLGIPVMLRVNRDLKLYYKCVCFCKQHKSIHSSVHIAEVLTSDNRIRVLTRDLLAIAKFLFLRNVRKCYDKSSDNSKERNFLTSRLPHPNHTRPKSNIVPSCQGRHLGGGLGVSGPPIGFAIYFFSCKS